MYQVGIFLFNDIELLDFAGPLEVFSVSSQLHDDQLFRVFTITADGREIKTINGLRVVPDYSFGNHPQIDILVIPGGNGSRAEISKPDVLAWVRTVADSAKVTMSVCSGARLLGKLGLLDNLEATTHHEVLEDLQKIAPAANLNPDVRFVDNGRIMTSGGISAGIDLALHIVRNLYGPDAAKQIIRYMEYGDWRAL